MQAMQYKISLPADYDMDIIKNRIKQNGSKTDRFPDLLFKAYLITEKAAGALANSYCPLYVWKETEGMNQFIFQGFFDHIIQSFGWKNIEIGITALIELKHSFKNSHFVVEQYTDITPRLSLKDVDFNPINQPDESGKVIIYNPDKWKMANFTFFEHKPVVNIDQKIYSILHLSSDK
ncbi:DUF4865 family protein [Neisseriaceae bacterium ESL0693]|nr:DUF4865 family protein [Neisseriaceae bacterium ESL0693]